MKPKTKIQQVVNGLAENLPTLSEEQRRLAYKHTVPHVGKLTKSGIYCTECEHTFPNDSPVLLLIIDKTIHCPKCGERLTIDNSKKRCFKQEGYFGLYTVVDNFQVLRFFHVFAKKMVRCKSEYYIQEVAQRWIKSSGEYTQRGLLRNAFCL